MVGQGCSEVHGGGGDGGGEVKEAEEEGEEMLAQDMYFPALMMMDQFVSDL